MKRSIVPVLLLCVAGCIGNSNKIPLPFTDAQWELRTGTYEKNPLIVRLNRTLINFVGSLKYEVVASVALKQPNAEGLPSETESASLKNLENALSEKLDKSGLAVYAMSVTMDKKCDFVFFTNKKGAVNKVLSSMGFSNEGYPIDVKIKRDDKWTNYKWFHSFVGTKGWN